MTRVRLHPSGHSVEVPQGSTVLEALEKSGYALPNNCRAGACGECKVKVLDGQFDQGFVMDMALTEQERAEGFGLMCMAKPASEELVIEWGTADAKPKLFPPREGQAFVVTDRIDRTPRITELRLRPQRDAMRYWPGQYLMLGDPQAGVPLRSYSIANAPRSDGELVLQITRQTDGLTSAWVHDSLQAGAKVKVNGPYGTFIGDPAVETPVLCLAAGSGLAPILALTEAALRRTYTEPVTLLFSAATQADLYDAGLMAWWAARHRNFRYRPTLTRGEPANPKDLKGRIPAVLPSMFTDLSKHSVFVAGTPQFVGDCVAAVKALGALPSHVHTEGYYPQNPPLTPAADQLVTPRST